MSAALETVVGTAQPGTNDAIDNQLLTAVERDAVDYLVTSDTGIHAKARRAGLAARVVTPVEALAIVRNLFPPAPAVIPPVRHIKAHLLDETDPIFDSFRADYPEFDDWLRRCKRQHRDAWVVGASQQPLLALTILKREEPAEHGLAGSALKVCSFKVADRARGFRYGELLLRVVFEEAYRAGVQWVYVTVFDRQQDLIRLFSLFGLDQVEARTPLGELVFAKPVHPTDNERAALLPLPFHVRFGPRYVKTGGASLFIVPIRPEYHELLFPDVDPQAGLFPGETTFGNGILKAYLCHAPIRRLAAGDVLVFYRSGSRQARAIGVIEETMVSRAPDIISRFVGRRTVYKFGTIVTFCAHAEVLAILFRQAESLKEWMTYEQLVANQVLAAPPQTILRVSQKRGVEWLTKRIER
jgi:GNAT superfamily N-acetyltransferase